MRHLSWRATWCLLLVYFFIIEFSWFPSKCCGKISSFQWNLPLGEVNLSKFHFAELLYETDPQTCHGLQAGVSKNVSWINCERIVLLARMFPAGWRVSSQSVEASAHQILWSPPWTSGQLFNLYTTNIKFSKPHNVRCYEHCSHCDCRQSFRVVVLFSSGFR